MTSSPWAWSFEPVFVVAAAVAGWWWLRARRAEPSARRRHAVCFGSGLALIVVALDSPLETIAVEHLVVAHLLQNVAIGDWAPMLLLLGLTPGMRTRLAERGGRPLARLVRPQVALPVWIVGWYVIHLGPVFDAFVRNGVLLNVEHALLIALGLLFWWPVLIEVPRAVSTLGRLAYVFAAFFASAFLGLALTFAPPIYDWYAERPERLWGISAARDQSYGGILMSAEQAAVFLAVIVWLLLVLFREEAEEEQRLADAQRAAGLRDH